MRAPAEVEAALWETRTLVKTSARRNTPPLLTAADFPVYIAALRQSRLRAMRGILARGQREQNR